MITHSTQSFAANPSVYNSITLGNFGKCWYCGTDSVTTSDHFWPKSKGGRLKVRACQPCNQEKAAMTPNEWVMHLQKMKEVFEKRGNMSIQEKFDRMILATESLWEKVKWSISDPGQTFNPDKMKTQSKKLATVLSYGTLRTVPVGKTGYNAKQIAEDKDRHPNGQYWEFELENEADQDNFGFISMRQHSADPFSLVDIIYNIIDLAQRSVTIKEQIASTHTQNFKKP